MADGDLFIHVEVEIDNEITVTTGAGSAGSVEPTSTAGTISKPTPGRPE